MVALSDRLEEVIEDGVSTDNMVDKLQMHQSTSIGSQHQRHFQQSTPPHQPSSPTPVPEDDPLQTGQQSTPSRTKTISTLSFSSPFQETPPSGPTRSKPNAPHRSNILSQLLETNRMILGELKNLVKLNRTFTLSDFLNKCFSYYVNHLLI